VIKKFDSCTRELGPLRQLLFACLTCNPPSKNADDQYSPAAVCYSCSVQCHGEHELVELFNKRNFVCDCGTTRLPSKSPCNLRINPSTNVPGGVHSEPAEENNKYNQNFQNRFCDCECDYDPHQQKGTMFQCLGLGTAEEGGCGEDWYHPGCLVGLGPDWYEQQKPAKADGEVLETITEVPSEVANRGSVTNGQEVTEVVADDDDDVPPPPGFPHEDDFEGFICYKCVDANPWIKRYAGSRGFLEPVFKRSAAPSPEAQAVIDAKLADAIAANPIVSEKPIINKEETPVTDPTEQKTADEIFAVPVASRKRKADDEDEESSSSKRVKDVLDSNTELTDLSAKSVSTGTTGTLKKSATSSIDCKFAALPTAPEGTVSLFFKLDFREHLCRCSDCFPKMAKHAQLLDEEDTYEPPVSESGDGAGGSTVGSGSIYDRGESALKNVDRVKAIEGVMAYNHLKEKLTPFFKEFAESGKAISAEDIKAHFAKMRGDETAIKEAGEAAAADSRREQSGY
jgi:E3 ubiquitin-protein ligase UBR7